MRVRDDRIGIFHAGTEVARHLVAAGRRQRRLEPAHLVGIVGAPGGGRPPILPVPAVPVPAPTLLRPLADYEVAAGGGW